MLEDNFRLIFNLMFDIISVLAINFDFYKNYILIFLIYSLLNAII